MIKANELTSAFHEKWINTRLNKDGSYSPRWKAIKDADFIEKINEENLPKYLRKAENGFEIDIANSDFSQLSPDWQAESLAGAEVVIGILEQESKGEIFTRNQIGDIIHNAWLNRNSWAKGSILDVEFKNLSLEEQAKDTDQYDIAKTIQNAKIKPQVELEKE